MHTRSILVIGLCVTACVGTTGGDVIDFPVAAAGPAEAHPGEPVVFDTDRGFHVTLTLSSLHIGAIYLSQNQTVSGVHNTC